MRYKYEIEMTAGDDGLQYSDCIYIITDFKVEEEDYEYCLSHDDVADALRDLAYEEFSARIEDLSDAGGEEPYAYVTRIELVEVIGG